MFKKAAEKAKKGLKSLDTALGAKPDPVWPDRPSESKFPGQVFQVLAAGGDVLPEYLPSYLVINESTVTFVAKESIKGHRVCITLQICWLVNCICHRK